MTNEDSSPTLIEGPIQDLTATNKETDMSTMQAAIDAKASGQTISGAALAEIIARSPQHDGAGGPGRTDTTPTRQRQVGLG